MEESISGLMLKEHKRLDVMLEDFEKSLVDTEKAKELLNKFKWNLEKHFFVEEKAIFDISISISGEEISEVFDLLQEHSKIMVLLKGVEGQLAKESKPGILDLKETIIKHRKFENQIFYPKLDLELNENLKRSIMERIKEIIRA